MSINKSSMFTQAPFANVPGPDVQRSTFDRSKKYATSFDAGYMIPVFMEEVYSGDTSEMRPSHFARFFSALKLPNFDNLYFETFWFYIRNRLLWDHFANFNGFQENPGDSVDYTVPQVAIPSTGYAPGTLYNYMGWPSPNTADTWTAKTTNALPGRAYRLTMNEWFRDQNYVDSMDFNKGDGPDVSAYGTELFRRMKRPDRFTSILPEPQKGPDVTLPIGGQAPVYGKRMEDFNTFTNSMNFAGFDGSGNRLEAKGYVANIATRGFSPQGNVFAATTPFNIVSKEDSEGESTVYADMAAATMANVNNIRLLFQIQKVYEKDMRGGTRATEFYRVHFGVVVPDYTIQRPELLSTSSDRIVINPVAQTSESGTTPQGTLTAFGVMPPTAGGSFIKSFDEHGWLMCLVNIRADITYSQGVDKFWMRETRFDYYLPTFAHLGEEAVYQDQIYVLPSNYKVRTDAKVLGYQERWYDLRFPLNLYTGLFQPQVASNLAAYHLGQHFESEVTIDDEFMSDNPPIDRIVSVTNEHAFFVQSFFSHKMTRPLPMFSVPGLIDHF